MNQIIIVPVGHSHQICPKCQVADQKIEVCKKCGHEYVEEANSTQDTIMFTIMIVMTIALLVFIGFLASDILFDTHWLGR